MLDKLEILDKKIDSIIDKYQELIRENIDLKEKQKTLILANDELQKKYSKQLKKVELSKVGISDLINKINQHI